MTDHLDAMRRLRSGQANGPVEENPAPVYYGKRSSRGGDVLLTNIDSVPGSRIVEHFGLVSGSIVRSKNFGSDFLAGMKNIVGGELKGYTKLLDETRDEAIRRMKEQARELGANAVVNVRFATSSVAQGAAELYVYGTAVRVE